MTIDASELALLTDEERAAIEDPEFSADELAALQGIADDAAPEDAEDDADEVLDADGNPVETTTVVDPAPKVDATPDPEPTPATKEDAKLYQAELPADFAAQVDAIKAKADDLQAQFKEGDIDFDSYNLELAKVNAEREALNGLKLKADISAEMVQQQSQRAWKDTVNAVMDRAAKDGIDYRKDAAKGKDLDTFVKFLANDEANQDKSMQWFMDEAHKRVMALHGIAAPKAADPKIKLRAPPIGSAPKTLSQVPGGDGPGDVGGDSFANLDNLEGYALEDALAKLSKADRERYAQGA